MIRLDTICYLQLAQSHLNVREKDATTRKVQPLDTLGLTPPAQPQKLVRLAEQPKVQLSVILGIMLLAQHLRPVRYVTQPKVQPLDTVGKMQPA